MGPLPQRTYILEDEPVLVDPKLNHPPRSGPRLNGYTCGACKHRIVTADVAHGVTPFMIGCTKGCGGAMTSAMYPPQLSVNWATFEWWDEGQSCLSLRPRTTQPVVLHDESKEQYAARLGLWSGAVQEGCPRTVDEVMDGTVSEGTLRMRRARANRKLGFFKRHTLGG